MSFLIYIAIGWGIRGWNKLFLILISFFYNSGFVLYFLFEQELSIHNHSELPLRIKKKDPWSYAKPQNSRYIPKFNSKRKRSKELRKSKATNIPSYINSKRKREKETRLQSYNSGPEITPSESPKYPRPQKPFEESILISKIPYGQPSISLINLNFFHVLFQIIK